MFTGLVEEIGTVERISPMGGGKRIAVKAQKVLEDAEIDDSIAINGVCQTVTSRSAASFEVVAVEETVRKTAFRTMKPGDRVNLERALRLSDRLGGHIVQGHVDCVGKIMSVAPEGAGTLYKVSFPAEFSKYVVPVGSICVDGVSLTAARVEGASFTVSVIPHTRDATTLSLRKSGDEVNLEFDILGKYVEKLLESKQSVSKQPAKSSVWDSLIDQPKI